MVEIILFSWIAELLRQPSDIAVLMGVMLICFAMVGNFYLFQFIKKQFKQRKK